MTTAAVFLEDTLLVRTTCSHDSIVTLCRETQSCQYTKMFTISFSLKVDSNGFGDACVITLTNMANEVCHTFANTANQSTAGCSKLKQKIPSEEFLWAVFYN